MLGYEIRLEADDNQTLLVSCPLLPEVVTFGDDEQDACRHAVGAIEEAIAARISDAREVLPPVDSARAKRTRGTTFVRVPAMTALKVQLYKLLRDSGMTRAELARRLTWHRESVDRLFQLDHASKLEQIEAAAKVLGRAISFKLEVA